VEEEEEEETKITLDLSQRISARARLPGRAHNGRVCTMRARAQQCKCLYTYIRDVRDGTRARM